MRLQATRVNLLVSPGKLRVVYRPRMVPQRSLFQDWKCPKCGVRMESQQLKGVIVERCPSCSGIFLDDGELEELLGTRGNQ